MISRIGNFDDLWYNFSMTIRPSSLQFDVAFSALAAVSYLKKWDSKLWIGLQGFSLATLADRSLRPIFLVHVRKLSIPLIDSLASAVVEEVFYSVILRTSHLYWMAPRLIVSLLLGMASAHSLKVKRETLVGLTWAIAREVILKTTPQHISFPLLVGGDSLIFGLCEIHQGLPLYSSAWFYKLLSGSAFRLTAHLSTSRGTSIAAIAQHVLFNVSRYL